jgi:hypothetical protein
MTVWIITLLLASMILLIVLQKTALPLLRNTKLKKRLMKEGMLADAVLLNLQQTGLYVNNLPQVKLLMQVHPKTGRNYITEVKEVLSITDLAHLHIGSTLQVKYNPVNVKQVVLVKE